jgi:RNA polymerase sigma factor (sigma-70 family)
MVERRFAERRAAVDVIEPPDLSGRDEMRKAMMALPMRQRTAIVLRYFEDLSEAQTAELMHCRPGAVKSLVSRGTSTLRSLLGDG